MGVEVAECGESIENGGYLVAMLKVCEAWDQKLLLKMF